MCVSGGAGQQQQQQVGGDAGWHGYACEPPCMPPPPTPPGTYAGMVERLSYLQGLGINCVELLPVQEFNELEYYSPIPGHPGQFK